MLFGTLEAGGTKMVLSVGNEANELLEQTTIPTESPDVTIPAMIEWFRDKKSTSISVFKKSAVLDLNNMDQKSFQYYTVYAGSVFNKQGSDYKISYLNKQLYF